mmetsp:Transcript_9866/g.36786  ORF Transcript_9866/g.36786 Transcript_9866/m.36786 type:complete len:302 (+) Transcript_9866:169-1074(+)
MWATIRQARTSPIVFTSEQENSSLKHAFSVTEVSKKNQEEIVKEEGGKMHSKDNGGGIKDAIRNLLQRNDNKSDLQLFVLGGPSPSSEMLHHSMSNSTTPQQQNITPQFIVICAKSPGNVSTELKKEMLHITRINMKPIYGTWDEEEKHGELFEEDNAMMYLCIMESRICNSDNLQGDKQPEYSAMLTGPRGTPVSSPRMVAFCAFLYDKDDYRPVLYLYELQIHPEYQGMGLGKWFMSQLIYNAQLYQMDYFMLTVQNKNEKAFEFYRNKWKFEVDRTDPTKFGKKDADFSILSLGVGFR